VENSVVSLTPLTAEAGTGAPLSAILNKTAIDNADGIPGNLERLFAPPPTPAPQPAANPA